MEAARKVNSGRAGFLGIERSLTGKRWERRELDERIALALAQQLGLEEPVARVLAARRIDPDAAPGFLDPSLRRDLPDPSQLADMNRAASLIADAVTAGKGIAVFGDYDVDGATSSALLLRFFRALGSGARAYIPDRMAEGYGPNAPALRKLRAEGADLVITVDCGITAHAAIEEGRKAGLEIIVVDHHAAAPRLPPASAIVNPNRLDDQSGLGHLAAVGVTFLLAVAVNRELRERGYFSAKALPEPKLLQWLDLVALGTVCDVVPLLGLNRTFVVQGLKVISGRGNPGLSALSDVAGLSERPDSYHLGFLLGPRVNAGGRVGKADLGTRLLSTVDATEAQKIAAHLDQLNSERREIEAVVLDQAITQVEAEGPCEGLVFASGQGWHPGVIGIVASRLKDRYNLPALVVALESGIGKGSGRSLPGVDLGAAVIAATQAELLINGGGHPMAAGLTVSEGNLPALRAFLAERLGRRMVELGYRPSLGFDGALQPGAATGSLVESLQRVGPFGAGNAEPRFAFPAVAIEHADVVGDGHVRCRILGADGKRIRGIAFRSLDSPLGEALLTRRGQPLHIAGKLRRDAWIGGDAVQLFIDDAAVPEG